MHPSILDVFDSWAEGQLLKLKTNEPRKKTLLVSIESWLVDRDP